MRNYYLHRTILLVATLIAAVGIAKADTWDGSISTAWYENGEPYEIHSAADLAGLAQLVNDSPFWNRVDFAGKTITLMTDIDLGANGASGLKWPMIGDDDDNPFRGTFNGNGHTISNVYVNNNHGTGSDEAGLSIKMPRVAGLFGVNEGTIQNLTVQNGYFLGIGHHRLPIYNDIDCAGAIAGVNNGTIENCTAIQVSPEVRGGHYAGSICGQNNGTVTGCLAAIKDFMNDSDGTPVGIPMVSDGTPETNSFYRLDITEEDFDQAKLDADTTINESSLRTLPEVAGFENSLFIQDGATLMLDITTRGHDYHGWTDNGYYITSLTADGGATSEIIDDQIAGDELTLFRLTRITYTMYRDNTTNSIANMYYAISAIRPTGVEENMTKAQRIYSIEGYAIVEATAGDNITIADMAGHIVYNDKARSSRTLIPLKAGIYIVNGTKILIR
ncbi:MAG TPA: hypothetical protein H9982_05150 [Candidatus Barnesiella excrementipullorum]|uniref:T9SS C-terminal target domain-containing protein n=1 Tax=Candidatus Barnesiella excrementipullorum TaxID=2838479 RepID=A0A9D1VRK9_9BACT|nr:hypothetical protein [Candidatus Barnesiella excrementipullorum]